LSRFVPQALVTALQQPLPFKLGLGEFAAAITDANKKKWEASKSRVDEKDVVAIHILESDLSAIPDVLQPIVSGEIPIPHRWMPAINQSS